MIEGGSWLIVFDDGIGGTADGAARLLATCKPSHSMRQGTSRPQSEHICAAVEDDDTPGKLLYHYPPGPCSPVSFVLAPAVSRCVFVITQPRRWRRSTFSSASLYRCPCTFILGG